MKRGHLVPSSDQKQFGKNDEIFIDLDDINGKKKYDCIFHLVFGDVFVLKCQT